MQTSMNIIMPQSLASVFVDTPAARRLVGLFGISMDLHAVADVADRLGRHLNAVGPLDRILTESLTWHIVIRYGRCFDGAQGRNAQLHRAQVERLAVDDYLTLHDGLIDRRHRTFAHAGEQCSDQLIVHLMTGDPQQPQLAATPSIEGPGPIADPEQPDLIAGLCRALAAATDAQCEAAAARVDLELRDRHADIIADLRAHLGRHATPEQTAYSLMQRLGR